MLRRACRQLLNKEVKVLWTLVGKSGDCFEKGITQGTLPGKTKKKRNNQSKALSAYRGRQSRILLIESGFFLAVCCVGRQMM